MTIATFPNGLPWQVTDSGIIAPGETVPRRSAGEPVTLRRIAATFATQLAAIPDTQRRRTLAALIATESGGHLQAKRFESRLGDWSYGPCQMLTQTAVAHMRALGIAHPEPLTKMSCDNAQLQAAWLDLLSQPDVAVRCAAHYCAVSDAHWNLSGDPIRVYACYNAGSPRVADDNVWGLVSYGSALDHFASWYGDACAVIAVGQQPVTT